MLAIGNPVTKRSIFSKIRNSNLSYPSLIHPSVLVCGERYVDIEEGVYRVWGLYYHGEYSYSQIRDLELGLHGRSRHGDR